MISLQKNVDGKWQLDVGTAYKVPWSKAMADIERNIFIISVIGKPFSGKVI